MMTFTNLELNRCAFYRDSEGDNAGFWEPLDDGDPPQNALLIVWTIYGRTPDRGVVALADLPNYESAAILFDHLKTRLDLCEQMADANKTD